MIDTHTAQLHVPAPDITLILFMADFEHELFLVDDTWRMIPTDAVAFQLRDTSINHPPRPTAMTG